MIEASTWQKVIDKNGVQTTGSGQFAGDPFATLALQAYGYKDNGWEPARMTVTVANGIDYNQVKVVVTAHVICPQTEQHMQLAAEAGFLKALEMVNEASESLGMQPLPKVY
jgi:hypothetical protein